MNNSAGWLNPVLEQHLAPVSAPDQLWDRIQHASNRSPGAATAVTPRIAPRSTPYVGAMMLAAASLALLAVAAWRLVPRPNHAVSRETLVIEALSGDPEDLDLRSNTVGEIRTWVKSRTGLDLPLPVSTSPRVQLAGVCAVKGGTPSFRVAYRVGGHKAALLVSKASPTDSGNGRHRFLKCDSIGTTRVSSWTMRGQLYTLAYAAHGDNRDECLLCHNGAVALN